MFDVRQLSKFELEFANPGTKDDKADEKTVQIDITGRFG